MGTTTPQLEPALVESQVLESIRDLLTEKGKAGLGDGVSLDSTFEHDLGLESLDLVELMTRLETRLEVKLPDDLGEQSDTPAGWVRAILEGPGIAVRKVYRITPPREDPLKEPVSASTLVDVLVQHAEADPGRIHIHLLGEEEGTGEGITYGSLYEEASKIAGGLADLGLRRNETVGIMLPSSADFFFVFFGVLLAGGIPVPVYPPTRPERIEDYVRRQIVVLRNASIRFMISFQRIRAVTQILRVNISTLIEVTTVDELRRSRARLGAGSVRPSATALLQYTSGSTAVPKGVVLSHANLIANLRGIGAAVGIHHRDAVVSWLPLYSDLGLIGCWLLSLYHAIPLTVISPLDFLKRPERWLKAVSEARGTLSAAPNFAYEMCARRIPAWTLEGVDLSCWRVAVNAGEPVLPETMSRFAQRFAPFGFQPESLLPCFGLAESTVALTMPPAGRLPALDYVKREPFETARRAEPAGAGDPDTLRFYSAGRAIQGQEIRVVGDDHEDAPERVVGCLLFRGTSTMQGYYRNADATSATIREDGWVDSCDYGYMAGGEFYFTGRSKDSIEKGGRSMSPLDVEVSISDIAGVEPGAAVAISTPTPTSRSECLIVAAETRATSEEELRRIEAEIVRVVDSQLGMPPDQVLLLGPEMLPRTSNGKIRRNDIRALCEKGKLRSRYRPPWRQIVRLRAENLGSLLALGLRRARAAVARGWTTVAVSTLAGLCGSWCRLSGATGIIRPASQWILRLCGQRYRVQGAARLNRGRPSLLVANRSGELDPLVVAAAIPGRVVLADTSALNGLPAPIAFLLKPLLVGYSDKSVILSAGALRERISEALAGLRTVVVFPDGPVGAPVVRSRYRLDPFQAGAEKNAAFHPTAVRERALHWHAADRARARKVTMIIVREPLHVWEPVHLEGLREQVREAIGEYHA